MKLILPASIAGLLEPRIPALAPGCRVVRVDDAGVPDGDIADAVAFYRWWSPAIVAERVLAGAPGLRWMHTPSAGVDYFLTPELAERDIVLTNSAGAHAIPIAEFVMMYMLSHVKRTRELMGLLPENAWDFETREELDELAGKTLVLLGLGAIGREIARRAAAFGMRVLASRRNAAAGERVEHVERVVGPGGLRELLPEADYLAIAAPLTSETRGMVDAGALALLKPGAYLINIARGEIVVNEALIAALESGRLAGAALDVTPEEPLPPEHPLWRAPNIWITPHISYSSPRTRERMFAMFLENLRRFAAGEPLVNVVDKQAGY